MLPGPDHNPEKLAAMLDWAAAGLRRFHTLSDSRMKNREQVPISSCTTRHGSF